jgi:hypothetical protein
MHVPVIQDHGEEGYHSVKDQRELHGANNTFHDNKGGTLFA